MKKNIAFALFAILIGCSNPPKGIVYTKNQYGNQWPFTVDKVDIYCTGYKNVFLDAEGKTYCVNGKSTVAAKGNESIHNLQEIWKDDPELPSTKITLPNEFISNALKNCNE